MKRKSSKVTLHMVSSLDGFIAKKDNDVTWLKSTDSYENGVVLTEEYMAEFLKTIDCYIMGSHTYEHAIELGWSYGEVPVFVLTNREITTDKKNVEFHSSDLNTLVSKRLKPNYKNIWMVGGAMLTKEFLRLNLVDDIIISIVPIILGDGLLFFDFVGQEKKLHLKDITTFKDGMVELWYEIKKS